MFDNKLQMSLNLRKSKSIESIEIKDMDLFSLIQNADKNMLKSDVLEQLSNSKQISDQ
jgi:hypothetical protein